MALSPLDQLGSQFTSRRLFYPSAGDDLLDPIKTFLPHVDDFWFVDITYGLRSNALTEPSYQCVDVSNEVLRGVTIKRKLDFRIRVQTERYAHVPTGRRFTVNMCKGRGYNAFRVAIRDRGKRLSVFYYRGDSMGEGGSGFYWLRKGAVARIVLAQLDPCAVVVSDGSNAMSQFSRYRRNLALGADAVAKCKSFEYGGRRLECIDYLGQRNGSTLAWRVENV